MQTSRVLVDDSCQANAGLCETARTGCESSRRGDPFALAMNYSAVANHVVNLNLRVYSHVPVSFPDKHKNKNCIRSIDLPIVR